MSESLEKKVLKSIILAEKQFYRLVLIVGTSATGKTSLLNKIARIHKADPVNVNLHLSRALLEISVKQRKFEVQNIVNQLLTNPGETKFLDNIEILFDYELNQDPLRLLQGLCRNNTIVSTWNGTYKNGNLTYAEPNHQEFKNYRLTDSLIVCMNGFSTVDSVQLGKEQYNEVW